MGNVGISWKELYQNQEKLVQSLFDSNKELFKQNSQLMKEVWQLEDTIDKLTEELLIIKSNK